MSHGHGALVSQLLEDLVGCPQVGRVLLTLNVPEPEVAAAASDRVRVFTNARPRGFAANHNAAFQSCDAPYFAVVNPDIRVTANPFPDLLRCLGDPSVATCAPAVVNPRGLREDSIREFPTVARLVRKALRGDDGRVPFPSSREPFRVPWVAGMFMLFRSADFAAIGGFDEGFFLYYEDVDLCARLWKRGRSVVCCPSATVTHDARRASRQSLRHMAWHAQSMMRYLLKHPGRSPRLAP